MSELATTPILGNAVGELKSALRSAKERGRRVASAAADRLGRAQARHREEERRRTFDAEAIPHMDALFNYAMRMTFSEADAQDLVQETYLKAFRFWDSFEVGTNCKAWLFRILKNSYINRYRRQRKSLETVDFDQVEEFYHSIRAEESDANDLSTAIFDNILDDEVTRAIEALPEDFRTVVILCDIEGFTYEEIAEFVDCPVGTVRSRLHRGRRLLREALLEYAGSAGYDVGIEEDGSRVAVA